MSESYPDDAVLLAMQQDPVTGVEYIPTGKSPYFLEFRQLVQRTLLAGQRANDLRVYQESDLQVGVRPGRCRIGQTVVDFPGQSGLTLSPSAIVHLWLDTTGAIVQSTTGLPSEIRSILPLAVVVTGPTVITALTDLRGETFLNVPSLASLGVLAEASALNQAFVGLGAGVTATALNRLTAGAYSDADADHRHTVFAHSHAGETGLLLSNDSDDPAAAIVLAMNLSSHLSDTLTLQPDPVRGWLTQRYDGRLLHMLGVTSSVYNHQGTLTVTLMDRLMGTVPVSGSVVGVYLSCAANLQSSVGTDGITATVKVNGQTVTTTAPKLTSGLGSGFRSTARGQGTAGVVKTDGTQNVQRGDVLTVDLVRTVTGSVSTEMIHPAVLVVMQVNQPG